MGEVLFGQDSLHTQVIARNILYNVSVKQLEISLNLEMGLVISPLMPAIRRGSYERFLGSTIFG